MPWMLAVNVESNNKPKSSNFHSDTMLCEYAVAYAVYNQLKYPLSPPFGLTSFVFQPTRTSLPYVDKCRLRALVSH